MRTLIVLFFSLGMTCAAVGQTFFVLQAPLEAIPSSLSSIKKDISIKYTANQWLQKNREWQSLAIAEGYFLFALEAFGQKDSCQYFQIDFGPFFEGITLVTETDQQYIDAKQLQRLVQDSLSWYLNNGHPFTEVKMIFTSGQTPTAKMSITKGPEVRWGKLVVKPEGVIKEKVLANLIQIESGRLFKEQQLQQAQFQVEGSLPFKLRRAPEWMLDNQQADVYFYLERIKMSSATGIIGLQQNPGTQKNDLVGELHLQLQNTWQRNEKFFLHWRSIAPQTQMLKATLGWPYIGGSSYGINAGFALYKRDTSFLEVKANLGLSYLLAKNWQLLALIDFWQSNALVSSASSNDLKSFSTRSYGIGIQRQQLDFLPNPTKGMLFKVNYLVGNKRAQNDILTWRLELAQRYFLPIAKRQVLSINQQFEHVQATTIFSNELYRFGGLERMRGFDEDAFFASTIAFAGLEYRYLLDQYAHFSVFTDWAWLENQVLGQQNSIYAFGLGLVIGSENGQFKLSYALGAEVGNVLQLNAGKLHVGFISYF